ncbi:MAG: MBL fold metallo-hydrolase [Candidatus Binatia bacterium]|nr:MBL fold metallo-hydrolase [Candidatus Binatia bacterium]
MKKIFFGLLALILVVGALAYAFRRPLTMVAISRVVAGRMAVDFIGKLPDGLHVGLCGAGSPLPDPIRSGPCVAVVAGDRFFVVDSGTGSSRNLNQMGMAQGQIDGILLTHFHSDHIDGLGELLMQRWVNGSHTLPTPLHGPRGVEAIAAGFNQAYAQDAVYRTAHHGEDIVPPSGTGAMAHPFPLPAPGQGVKIIEDGDLTVTAFAVDHEPVRPAVGYRFDYKDRSVLISGDTSKSENLAQFAEGVDLLVHEALAPQLVGLLSDGAANAGRPKIKKITEDILTYHATPVEVAEIARDSGAQELLFYHVVPPLLLPTMEEIFVEGVAETYSGPVRVGKDGTFLSLPTGSKEIAHQDLL